MRVHFVYVGSRIVGLSGNADDARHLAALVGTKNATARVEARDTSPADLLAVVELWGWQNGQAGIGQDNPLPQPYLAAYQRGYNAALAR